MTLIIADDYTLPSGHMPLTHARIAHANNWHNGGTVTASTTVSGYYADGAANILTYEKWKPTALPATWEYDFGETKQFDYICIGAHTLGTSGNSLAVHRWFGGAWVEVVPTTAILSDMSIYCLVEPTSGSKIRLTISGGTTPVVGVVKTGNSLQMQRPLYGGHTPLDLARQTTLRSTISARGEFLGRSKLRNGFQTEFEWKNLSAAWVREHWKPFQKALESQPFFIAWRPEAFPEVGFCNVSAIPIPTNLGVRDLMSVTMAVTGYGYD